MSLRGDIHSLATGHPAKRVPFSRWPQAKKTERGFDHPLLVRAPTVFPLLEEVTKISYHLMYSLLSKLDELQMQGTLPYQPRVHRFLVGGQHLGHSLINPIQDLFRFNTHSSLSYSQVLRTKPIPSLSRISETHGVNRLVLGS